MPYELSVVIASRNRKAALQHCLESLGRQTQAPNTFEVIVVDHGSTDGTARMLASARTRFALRALSLPEGGSWAARNAGAAAATGRVCVFLDDEITASPGLLAAHAVAHLGDPIIGVGRLTHSSDARRDWYARASASAANRQAETLPGRKLSWADCSGANMSVVRDAFLAIGGFSVDLAVGHDKELAFRLFAGGCRPRYLPDALGKRSDLRRQPALLADAKRLGAGYMALTNRHPGMLPALLRWFDSTGREILLRRLLLAMHVPPRALALFGMGALGRNRRDLWFGFVSRFAFWSAVRGSVSRHRWRQLTRGVPVLIYHAFEDDDSPGTRFVLPRARFRAHLRALAALRYHVISLETLVRALREGDLPPRAVVITIDDGYRDNFEIAFPELRRFRYCAAIFLVAGRLGACNDWDSGELASRALLSVTDVQGMAEDGLAFGSHTRTHPVLPAISDEALRAEIDGAATDLERELGRPVLFFSYPYGSYDDRALAAARERYVGACTTEPRPVGLDSDPFLLPRIEVRGTDSSLRLLRKLWLGQV